MLSAQAQPFIPPTMPEGELPLASDSALKYKIVNSSSYSFEEVKFNVSDIDKPEFKMMDLYIYSWTSNAVNGNGIS